jgi:cell division protein FtsW
MASTDVTVKRVERAGFGAAHVDYVLLLTVAALLLIGLMMVYSATFDWSYAETDSPWSFFMRQVIWVALGLAVMAVLSRIDYIWWRRMAVPIMGIALVLLVLVLAFGSARFGAQRTFLNGSVQPSEPAKLAVIIYIAAWLSSKGQKLRQMTYGLIPFAVLIGLIAGLIVLQPDFSTAILVVLTAGAMFFIAGADLLQVGLGCGVSGVTFYLLIMNSPHGADRLNRYLETLANSESISYHVEQALVALGSGGLFGRGLGASYQKFGYLPAPHTDSVFAVLGEELGLAGCLVVVALFAMLAQRGFKIAHGARDPFGAVLAAGLTCWLIFQALINVAVMTGTIPFTGIPLPFLSMGGSAMVSSLAAVGLLLSISRGSQAVVSTRDRLRPVTASSQVRDAGISYSVRKGGRPGASAFLWRRNRRPRVSRVGRR